jgi:hypothetical protein
MYISEKRVRSEGERVGRRGGQNFYGVIVGEEMDNYTN